MFVQELTAADVERLARKLGVWWSVDERRSVLGLVITEHDGQLLVQANVTESSSWAADAWTRIDPLTAAVILIGYARGLRVDVGVCPACRTRGSKRGLAMWEWDVVRFWPGDGILSWTRDARWKSAHYKRPRNVKRKIPEHVDLVAWAACSACTVDGTPTGRHTLTWEAAIIAALPRDLGYDARLYDTEWRARRDAYALARLTERDPPRYAVKRDADNASVWRLHEIAPGDAPTREALAVMADAMQASGDVFGSFVTAWLRGECLRCKGSGRQLDSSVPRAAVWHELVATWVKCHACNGHGSVLGSFAPALAEQVATIIGSEAA